MKTALFILKIIRYAVLATLLVFVLGMMAVMSIGIVILIMILT